MFGLRNQHTIASACEVTGRGYWSGQEVRVRFLPASADQGIRLVRVDLPGAPECAATSHHADGIQFRTNLAQGDACFEMVEHLLAALTGLEIDNCVVELDSTEVPGLDGSSLPFTEALQTAGLIIQPASRKQYHIDQVIQLELDGAVLTASPSPDQRSRYSYSLDYGRHSEIRSQFFRCELTPRTFTRQVAPARTFVTLAQADALRQQGVAAHVSNQELLVIGPAGPVENEYRFRNECARHKTLDLIGDLSLTGVDLIGTFESVKGGHRLNAMMASCLTELIEQARPDLVQTTQKRTHFPFDRAA